MSDIIETDDYWIVDCTFIFKPTFNKPIDKYVKLIVKCNKLLFGNYKDVMHILKYNNDWSENGQKYWIGAKFNQPFGNSLKKLSNLKILNLGHSFNQPLSNSLDNLINLKEIYFSISFNQMLGNSLENLTALVM